MARLERLPEPATELPRDRTRHRLCTSCGSPSALLRTTAHPTARAIPKQGGGSKVHRDRRQRTVVAVFVPVRVRLQSES